MSTFVGRFQKTWENIRRSPAQLPARVIIPADHVDEGPMGTTFKSGEHYFQVRINEMFLAYSRKWFDEYAPMVFAVSEFDYNGARQEVPFVVGPAMMEKYGKATPAGMIFSDTRVAGLHPYRGGSLTLSIVLFRIRSRENYIKQLLQLLENTASVLDVSTMLGTYLKLANVLFDGIEGLLGLGDTVPLIGLRKEFDPDANDNLEPHYFVLIDLPEAQIDMSELWVRNHQLVRGKNLADAKPFRDADYVLYSLVQTKERSDISRLPFDTLYHDAQKYAMEADEDSWKKARAAMLTLWQTMTLSPDLTFEQASALDDAYSKRVQDLRKKAIAKATLGHGKKNTPSELERKLDEGVKIFDW